MLAKWCTVCVVVGLALKLKLAVSLSNSHLRSLDRGNGPQLISLSPSYMD